MWIGRSVRELDLANRPLDEKSKIRSRNGSLTCCGLLGAMLCLMGLLGGATPAVGQVAVPIKYGAFIQDSISTFGQLDAYRFSGIAGQRVIIRMDPDGIDTYFRGMLELFSPSDSMLLSQYDDYTDWRGNHGGRQVAFVDYVLPQTGSYTLYVREQDGDMTSGYWLSLHCREVLRDSARIIPYNTTLTSVAVDPYGDIDAYRFSGIAGQRVIIRMDPDGIDTHFRGMLELFSPSDSMLLSQYDDYTGWPWGEHGGRQVAFVDYVLPQTGSYTLYVREQDGDMTSAYWLSLHCREVLRDSARIIPYNTTLTSVAVDPYGDIDAYRFSGIAGQRVIIRMDPDGIDTHFRGMLELFGPSDSMLLSQYDDYTGWPWGEHGGRQVAFVDYELPETGSYTLYVREQDGDMTSAYWLSLHCRVAFVDIGDAVIKAGQSISVPVTFFTTDSLSDFTLPLSFRTTGSGEVKLDSLVVDPNLIDTIIYNGDSSEIVFRPMQPPPHPDSVYRLARIFVTASASVTTDTLIIDTVKTTIDGHAYSFQFVNKSGDTTVPAFNPGVIVKDIPNGMNDPEIAVLPTSCLLFQNYPNPFNPSTTIEYSVPARAHVTIEIFNLLGQHVTTLVDETKTAGMYKTEWDGTDTAKKPVSTGVYLYRFIAGEFVETKKMLLLK